MNQTVEYIKELTAIASPTGFTREITNYLVETLEKLDYQPIRTAKGGVNVTVKGKNDDKQRYVTAHVDTLGAIVRAVKPDGRLKLDRIGGFPWNMIEGEKLYSPCSQYRKRPIRGTIFGPSDLLPRLQGCGELSSELRTIWEVRLDEKVTSEKETRDLGIEVGGFYFL